MPRIGAAARRQPGEEGTWRREGHLSGATAPPDDAGRAARCAARAAIFPQMGALNVPAGRPTPTYL